MPGAARAADVEAGPIWNNDDANGKCPGVCQAVGATWSGQWRTTVPNRMSVCGCDAPMAPPPPPQQTMAPPPAQGGFIPMVGSCRGPGWNQGGWPSAQGYRTPAECRAVCESTPGCTSFDLARPRGMQFDCYLFSHTNVVGEGAQDTCFSRAPAPTARHAGRSFDPVAGSCRGPGWNANGWPLSAGYRTLNDAIGVCVANPSCTAFDVARPRGPQYATFLFGHGRVMGEGNQDTCFVSRAPMGTPPPPPPPPPSMPPPSMPQPPPAMNAPMDEGTFGGLLGAIKAEAFSKGKLRVIQDAARSSFFTVDQLKRIVEQLPFSADKLGAAEAVAPRLVDKQNSFQLYSAFPFESDKQKLRAILSRY